MKPIKLIVRADQIVKCNVVKVTNNNIIGIRNTIAIKYDELRNCIYDVINEEYIKLRKDDTKGICTEILNVPFKDNKRTVNLFELKDLFKKYSEKQNLSNDLYNPNKTLLFDQIEENLIPESNSILKKRNKRFIS